MRVKKQETARTTRTFVGHREKHSSSSCATDSTTCSRNGILQRLNDSARSKRRKTFTYHSRLKRSFSSMRLRKRFKHSKNELKAGQHWPAFPVVKYMYVKMASLPVANHVTLKKYLYVVEQKHTQQTTTRFRADSCRVYSFCFRNLPERKCRGAVYVGHTSGRTNSG